MIEDTTDRAKAMTQLPEGLRQAIAWLFAVPDGRFAYAVSEDDYDLIQQREDAADLEAACKARESGEPNVDWDDLKAELGV